MRCMVDETITELHVVPITNKKKNRVEKTLTITDGSMIGK